MQELTPEEPKKEDPFEGAEVEAAESAAEVKAEPAEDAQAGPAADTDDDMEKVPEEEVVHMPASQDDPGTSLPSSMHASQIHRHSYHCFVVH